MSEIKAGPPLVVLGLGSNRGNSSLIIHNAIESLEKRLSDIKKASLYDTAPLYITDQRRFINTAIAGYYAGTPRELLQFVNYVEACFGRDRAKDKHWGERLLDIDILLFEDLIVDEPDLIIPHALLKERRFVLEPLIELFPDRKDLETGLYYRDICKALPDQGVVRLSEL